MTQQQTTETTQPQQITLPAEVVADLVAKANQGMDDAALQKVKDDAVAAYKTENDTKVADLQAQVTAALARRDAPGPVTGQPDQQTLNVGELTDADIDAYTKLPYGSPERQKAYETLMQKAAGTKNPIGSSSGKAA